MARLASVRQFNVSTFQLPWLCGNFVVQLWWTRTYRGHMITPVKLKLYSTCPYMAIQPYTALYSSIQGNSELLRLMMCILIGQYRTTWSTEGCQTTNIPWSPRRKGEFARLPKCMENFVADNYLGIVPYLATPQPLVAHPWQLSIGSPLEYICSPLQKFWLSETFGDPSKT